MSLFDCRFYEAEMPDLEDLVHVQVTKVTDACAYVKLTEYNGLEGMVLLAEVATRRIRSLLKEIRVGQKAVMLVHEKDEKKGTLNLSRKRVNVRDRKRFLAEYAESKRVQSVMKKLSSDHSVSLQELCEKITWPLYAKFDHAIDVFKNYVNTGDDAPLRELDISDGLRKDLLEVFKRKLTPQAIKLKAQVEVSCYEFDGIGAIRDALVAGKDAVDAKMKEDKGSAMETEGGESKDGKVNLFETVSIKVLAPPLYEVATSSMGQQAGVDRLNLCLEAMEKAIVASSGTFNCKVKPEVHRDDEDIEDDEDKKDDDDDSGSESEGEDMTMGKAADYGL